MSLANRLDRLRDNLSVIDNELAQMRSTASKHARRLIRNAACELDMASDWAHTADSKRIS